MIIATEEAKGQSRTYIFHDSKLNTELYKNRWTLDQQNKAYKIKEQVYDLYGCRPQVFLNFRQNYITIKVQKPSVFEKNCDRVLEYNKNLAKGHFFSQTKTGVLYELHIL